MASDLISRQQAIDGLSGHYIERINLNDWQAGWNAALDWLESAYLDGLPSAQPEPCEDAVSRKLMYELGATCMARRDENGELVALGRIDMLPSAQSERKTGHWIDEGFYAEGHGAHAFRCSECDGHIIEYEADPFCKWCGADMRGKDDGKTD